MYKFFSLVDNNFVKKGVFLYMKSLCIKTNNMKIINCLLNELKYSEIEHICFSENKFKNYRNVIIHYISNDNNYPYFFSKISNILCFLIIDEFEDLFIKRIINKNYFYFDSLERNKILKNCYDILSDEYYTWFDKKFNSLYDSIFSFVSNNKVLILDGFINFRLQSYTSILDNIVADAVNTYIIEKEYLEFISLLKLYINSQKNNSNVVHLVYKTSESILLDENKNIILNSEKLFDAKYLSDISFSSNDYTLNSLLNLLPKKIYIHLIDNQIDDFINTLQLIFENRVCICVNCELCNLYRYNKKILSKK